MTTLRALLLWCFAGLSACTTGVLVVHPDLRYQLDGDRYVRLRLETMRLDVVETKPGQFTVPNALCLRDAPAAVKAGRTPCRALQFRLPFLAWNGTDAAWPVKLGQFRLVRQGGVTATAGDETLIATDGDQTVALIPPHSGAHFDLLVHAAGIGPDDDPLRGEYKLIVQTGVGAGETLLAENLSVGSFSQVSQIVRFMGVATLLLVAAAAI